MKSDLAHEESIKPTVKHRFLQNFVSGFAVLDAETKYLASTDISQE